MEAFKSRQQYIQSTLKPNQALLVRQPAETPRNHDVYYPFHPDRSFYYLCGFQESDAWLLITPSHTILWSRANDPKRTLWDGLLMGEEAAKELAIDQWQSLASLAETLPKHLSSCQSLLTIGDHPQHIKLPSTIGDGTPLINNMRIIKDPHEIHCIKQACSISAKAHNVLMQQAHNLSNENAVAGLFLNETMRLGSQSLAYPTIAAAGINACTLHYTKNNSDIQKQDLVLVDAGCEYSEYAADITRTFPANGRFSGKQQAIYEAVLDTQESSIGLCKPNAKFSDINRHAVSRICQHLIDLKILNGSIDEITEKQLYLTYFPHRVGHTMGLDVHDIPLNDDTLQPGMVITIEPGIYVSEPNDFYGIGVRIEDNILITPNGHENLTHEAVKQVQDIEKMIRE
jgi:Xaa-Pro aminopeptidase